MGERGPFYPAVVEDGLPVSRAALEFARSDHWSLFTPGANFTRSFYDAVCTVVPRGQVLADVRVLLRSRRRLKLSEVQARVAYAFEKGVFTPDGGFKASTVEKAKWGAVRRGLGNGGSLAQVPVFGVEEWDEAQYRAIQASKGLPDRVSSEAESTWVMANLFEEPDFLKAPSRCAVKTWLAISRPGHEKLQADYTKMWWTKRLTPGDRTRKTPFDDDEVDEAAIESAEHEAERIRRLFGA